MCESTIDQDRSAASSPVSAAPPPQSEGPCAPQLAQAVDHALWALADLHRPRIAPTLTGQQLGNALAVRCTSIDTDPEAPAAAVAAARTACAHLEAGDTEEALLSLLTARETLGQPHLARGRPTP